MDKQNILLGNHPGMEGGRDGGREGWREGRWEEGREGREALFIIHVRCQSYIVMMVND